MKTHEAVMNWVTEGLASGRLHVGDHLPGERTLAETLQMSRSSLREAMRVLEALGTIRTATGSGPRSGTVLTAAPEQAFTLALTHQLATHNVAPHHMVEVRILLETWAAQHAQPGMGEWDAVDDLLTRMDDPATSLEEFLVRDAEFHITLSRAAGNPLISTLMDGLRTAIADHTLSRAKALQDWSETSARLRAEHREIADRLRAGEREQAAALLRAHIEGYYLETDA